MASTTHIRIDYLDGRVSDADTTTYMCMADRVAFERKFGTSAASMAQWGNRFDEEGNPKPGADLSGLHEEWVAFFAWRALARTDATVGDFAAFVDLVAGVTISDAPDSDATTGIGAVDPTPALRGGS